MLALIVRARTGYKIIRKVAPPPMTEQEARLVMLTQAVQQAQHKIEFMHGCLTAENFEYAYPEMTASFLAHLAELAPKQPMCVHSKTERGCPGCEARLEAWRLRGEAERVLAAS